MWNKLVTIYVALIRDPSVKRLALAMIASIFLHSIVMGKLNVTLPELEQKAHTLDARLIIAKPTLKTTPEPTVDASKIAAQKLKPEILKPVKPIKKMPDLPVKPPAEPPSIEANTTAALPDDMSIAEKQEPVLLPNISPDIAPNTPQNNAPSQAPQPAETVVIDEPLTTEPNTQKPSELGAIINQNAYQYVETDFDVRTKIDGAAQGKAKITYDLQAQQYKLKSLIEAKGLAALVISDLLQTSEGLLTQTGLQPTKYVYQYGNKADKTYRANFDWVTRKVTLISSKATQIEDINDGAQDLLSFMYQFMHVAPLQFMQISIATGKKLNTYDYTFEGEEDTNTSLGVLKTIHIRHAREDIEDKTELWLAIDYQYIPIKIRKTEKNGKVYELEATRINTIRPPQNN